MLNTGNSKLFLVNRSGSNIPVYSELVHSSYHTGGITVGGTQIGTIYPNEFYVVFKNNSAYVTSYKIGFRNSSGAFTIGYIETSPGYSLDDYAWAEYQEPFHYYNSTGSSLTYADTENINGSTYYVFTVKKAVAAITSSGRSLGTITVGTKLATKASTAGASNDQYMIFYYKQASGSSSWNPIDSQNSYAFVDTNLDSGSMPSNRSIY